jgi:hypothetical protein
MIFCLSIRLCPILWIFFNQRSLNLLFLRKDYLRLGFLIYCNEALGLSSYLDPLIIEYFHCISYISEKTFISLILFQRYLSYKIVGSTSNPRIPTCKIGIKSLRRRLQSKNAVLNFDVSNRCDSNINSFY